MEAVREIGLRLSEAQRRRMRRTLVVSGLAHMGAALLLTATPSLPTMTSPGVISVELVAMPRAAPPAKRPVPPRPAPKPPKPAPVVLPKEPTAPPPKPLEAQKPRPEPRPEPKPEIAPEPQAEPQEYSDVLADLREELGEPEAAEAAEAAAAPPGGGGGPGRPVSPEVAAWLRDARIHVRRSWVVPVGFRNESLRTVVEVELDAGGALRGEPRVVRRSGNPWYDDGVVRSIEKASPLPPPPEAGRWTFVMLSDEMF